MDQLTKSSAYLDQVPAIIIVTDSFGDIEYVSPLFTEHTGYSNDEVTGKNPRFLQSGLMPKAVYENLWQTILSGRVWRGELQNKKKTGELFWEKAVISGIQNDGVITNFLAIKEDITAEKQLRDELIASKSLAEERDRLKSRFLHNISHEIRTPMNGILGFAHLLKNPHLSKEDMFLYTDIIRMSGERLLNLVDNYTLISSIEADEMKVQITPTSINELLRDLYATFNPEMINKGLLFNYSISLSEDESVIETDGGKLSRILTNLIQNALKFTSNGKIDFGYTRKADFLEFYVSDSGIGIPEDQTEKIFKPFYSIDSILSSGDDGGGLGLAITKGFVEILGGSIRVNSVEGAGSNFVFSIPYCPVNTISHLLLTTKTDEFFPRSTLCILLVEDDSTSTLLLEQMLKGENITFLYAKNGFEAVELVEHHPEISLVLMDIKMPIMNGYDATRRIKEQRPQLPVIAQTAFTAKEERERAIQAGCNGFITKPIKKSELLELMKELILN